MKTLFVTAIYNDLWGTEMGGRPSRNQWYNESLISLSKMQADFLLFVSPIEFEKISNDLKGRLQPGSTLTVRPYDLTSHKYNNKIFEILQGRNQIWPERCFQIMYSKFLWLSKAISEFDDHYTNYYWIDAGLSNGSIFDIKYTDQTKDTFLQSFHVNTFNTKLLYNINQESDSGKIFCITKRTLEQAVPDEKYYSDIGLTERGKLHVVGGWIGGRSKAVDWLCESFNTCLDQAMSNGDLYSEEQILSVLLANFKDKFTYYCFDHWNLNSGPKDSDTFFSDIIHSLSIKN